LKKKAIVLVSFGSVDAAALERTLEPLDERFQQAFPEWKICRAFSSKAVRDKLALRTGIQVDAMDEALRKLADDAFEEVYVQPLFLTLDATLQGMQEYIAEENRNPVWKNKTLALARPLLLSMGTKDHPDDYVSAIEALQRHWPSLKESQAVLLTCNGAQQMEYAVLQLKLEAVGCERIFVCVTDGFPDLETAMTKMKAQKVQEVLIVPFMLLAGEHIINYLDGTKPDSPKLLLEQAGFKAQVLTKGLGENSAIQELFIQHLKDKQQAISRRHGRRKQALHETNN
jgi:sirohydrochlorin cobaltochelatase